MDQLQEDKIKAIRSCYLFENTEDDIIERLAKVSVIETPKAQSPLFEAGDEPDGLRIIMSGLVRIWVNDEEGQELTITLSEPGDCIGEIALLDGEARSANANTIEASRIVFLSKVAFDEVLDGSMTFARQLMILLCERLRRNTDDLSGFAFDDLQVRLSRKLYELAFAHAVIEQGTARFERKFSQTELAQMLGATREAINKRLAAMSKAGLISINNGWIVLPELERLNA